MPPRPLPPPPCPPCQGCDLPGGPPLPDGGAPLPLPRAAKIKDYTLKTLLIRFTSTLDVFYLKRSSDLHGK